MTKLFTKVIKSITLVDPSSCWSPLIAQLSGCLQSLEIKELHAALALTHALIGNFEDKEEKLETICECFDVFLPLLLGVAARLIDSGIEEVHMYMIRLIVKIMQIAVSSGAVRGMSVEK